MSDEFYTRPIFAVRDVNTSLAFYCDKLGFRSSWDLTEPNAVIAQVERNGLEIMLGSEAVTPRPSTPSVLTMSLRSPKKLWALYEEFVNRGVNIPSPPYEVPWQQGTYEFIVKDLDGNALTFWGEGHSE